MPMNRIVRTTVIWLILAGAVFSARVVAQDPGQPAATGYSGLALYETYCATCHGPEAKGNGVFAESLRTKPADLTMIARTNRGVFSRADVARIIDGRVPLKGHGGKDMPIWGDAFARTADGPDSVKKKIDSLVSYLESIQQKP
jgi:mono/diheme cytochrome c family protein